MPIQRKALMLGWTLSGKIKKEMHQELAVIAKKIQKVKNNNWNYIIEGNIYALKKVKSFG